MNFKLFLNDSFSHVHNYWTQIVENGSIYVEMNEKYTLGICKLIYKPRISIGKIKIYF